MSANKPSNPPLLFLLVGVGLLLLAVVVALWSPLGAKSAPAPALTDWTMSTDVPATPHFGSAVVVEQGHWEQGRPTCDVKLTNLRQVESAVSVYVVAESLDGATKYRSDQAVAAHLVMNQSETLRLTHFGFGSGEDIPLNQPFRCRVSGEVKVAP